MVHLYNRNWPVTPYISIKISMSRRQSPVSIPAPPVSLRNTNPPIIQEVTLVYPYTAHRRTQSQSQSPMTIFQQSLQQSESRKGSEDTVASLQASLKERHQFLNPSLSKNFLRLNMLKNLSLPNSPAPSHRTTALDRILPKKRMAEHGYIDRYYPHGAESRAVNRLPLPGNLDFNIETIKARRVDGLEIKRKQSEFEREATLAEQKDEIMRLMPSEEEAEEHFTARENSSLAGSHLPKYYWTLRNVAGNRPESREGAVLVLLSRQFYLFGGQSMTKRNDLRVLNPDTWTWSLIPTYYTPKGRIGHSICPFKQQLILFGGWSHYSSRLEMRRCYGKLLVLTLEGEYRWQRFTGGGDMPKSRRDHAMAYLGTSMLVFGGVDSRSRVLTNFRILDMELIRWKKPSIASVAKPEGRYFATLTGVFHPYYFTRWDFSVFNIPTPKIDHIMPFAGFYLFGGLSEENKELGDLWVLQCLETGLVWQLVTATGTPPCPRYAHSATFVGHVLVIFGGRSDSKGYAGCLSDLHILRLDFMRWDVIQVCGSAPEGRWGHAAAALGSKVLVLGGIQFHQFPPADLYVLETDPGYVIELLRQEEVVADRDRRRVSKLASIEFPKH